MSSDADADANTNTSDSERQSVRRQASASQSVSDSDATNVDNVDSDLAAERRNSDKVVTCTEGGWVRVDAVQRLAQLQM